MKKIFVSAGLAAIGAAGLQSVFAQGVDVVSPKAWNVAATLRGFYDDNYTTGNSKKGSAGLEFSPQISFNIPLQQTAIGIRYTYGLYYYQQREDLNQNPIDQTHQVDVWLDHAFNERWKANVTDTFAYGQEPELLDPNNNTLPYRANGDSIANHGNITLDTEWTRLFSTSVHYQNNFYDYSQSGNSVNYFFGVPIDLANSPSNAGLLNRVEQSGSLDLQWHFQPETMGFVGYQFSIVNYTGDEPIALYGPLVYMSDARDAMTHYGYVGVQHSFTPNLTGTVKGGASYTDNYNDPLQKDTAWAPYADLSLTYTYLPGCYAQVGFTHDINATDVASVGSNGSLSLYQESSVVYADINHQFTPKLSGTLIGRYQNSSYQGGNNLGSDSTYGLGLNLHYQFTSHFSADAGYNFDDLTSDIGGRGYTRNREYIGVGVNY